MAQNYTINSFEGSHNVQSDTQNMENNFECLRSNFSGASAPSNALAGHAWYDTGASARNSGDNQNLLKIYNQTRSTWYGVMTGDTSQKIPVYRNDQMDGWVIDTSVSDKVVAIKGGSVYTTAGTTAGQWASSSHTLTTSQIPAHTHPSTSTDGDHSHTLTTNNGITHNNTSGWGQKDTSPAAKTTSTDGDHSHSVNANTGGGSGHIHAADSNVRPTAAVCTIQYLDI